MAKSTAQLTNISRSGMLAYLMDLDVVSNNIANINTVAFKGSRANFQELLSNRILTGVQVRATQTINQQGPIVLAANSLSLAIQGAGFFSVTLPDGKTAYTRDGQFMLDSARNIVNANGYRLVWQGTIPDGAEEIRIDPNGAVNTRIGNTWTQSGTINLTRFPNPSGLTAYGQNAYLATTVAGTAVTGAPAAAGMGSIVGYAVEGSNVSMTSEMTQMITLQRAFQISSSVLSTSGEMISEAITMRR